ncbi:ABC transporter permease [Microbacterium dextranolyticum]|uniref:ABC transporter permease n=1 Tax=Microbacterium dextranolyticum TaxID=36806 RepID=A0A9W6HJV3_9MICO|nr:ABC transporter permease subunit [Microbacterium dextranolyticum]MBM7462287.1 osmoprotectant transport system permease protein [Microbacterium dextranolyticum]GLJ94537.1 ABC transporter permease [Microbacterium dextranolyticum]
MSWILDNLDLISSLAVDHLRQSAIPIVLGFLIAIPVGWVAWRYTRLRGPVLTTIGLLYTIPSLGLFALLAAVGVPYITEANLIVALTIYGVAIMTRSVTDGLDSVDPATRSAAVAVGFGPWRRFWTVDLPLSGPVLLAGLRVTATSTISLATVGILIGVQNLGYLFTNGFQRRIVPEILAGVVAVVVIALVIDLLLVLLGRLLMPWEPRRGRRRGGRAAAHARLAEGVA